MIGYPVLASLTGIKAVIPMTISVVFFNYFFTPLLIAFYNNTAGSGQQKLLRALMKNTLLNPFVLAAILGIIFALLHIPLPAVLNKMFSYINPSYVPCSLFAIGIESTLFKFSQNWPRLIALAGMNLIFFPILAVLISYMLRLSPFYAVSLIIFSALPTAKTVYIYAKLYHVNENETATIISFTTLVSLVTIPIVIFFCHARWPHAFIQPFNIGGK